MFLHSLLATVAFVPLPVDAKEKRPPSGPPTFVLVRALDKNNVTVLQPSKVIVPVTVSKQIIVNGVVQKVTQTEYRQGQGGRITERKIPLKFATFHNGAGERLAPEDGRKSPARPSCSASMASRWTSSTFARSGPKR